jgi:hypothetical protein
MDEGIMYVAGPRSGPLGVAHTFRPIDLVEGGTCGVDVGRGALRPVYLVGLFLVLEALKAG